MAMFSTVFGFSLFGLASRFGQLGIQKRNLFDNPGGHFVAMASFGFIGYWAEIWDRRSAVLLADKRAEIAEKRERAQAAAAS